MDLVTAIYRVTATAKLSCDSEQVISWKSVGQARGSLMEVETQLQISENLGYVVSEDTGRLLESCAEVGRILNGLISSVTEQAGF